MTDAPVSSSNKTGNNLLDINYIPLPSGGGADPPFVGGGGSFDGAGASADFASNLGDAGSGVGHALGGVSDTVGDLVGGGSG